MVIQAYKKVKANNGGPGIDLMDWEYLEENLSPNLYKLWNRLTSGSYFPMPVKEVPIKKKQGGKRKLGIPTILDRIAQQVVKLHLERILEPEFHDSSFGYRPGKNCHLAVAQAEKNSYRLDYTIDLDIKGFFDNIDHELLMKALTHYCKDKWVLMYVERWLKSGIIQKDGSYIDRLTGTPQGGVISPLLANLFLHVAFDKWMEINYPLTPFERYADDIVVHCKSESHSMTMLSKITERLKSCKLTVHPDKTKIAKIRGESLKKYPRGYDFLGFTIQPQWSKLKTKNMVTPVTVISNKSVSSVLEKIKSMKIHKRRTSIEELAKELKPVIQGIINYYCKFWYGHTHYIWYQLNKRLKKWVKWEKGLYKKASIRWLKEKYKEQPNLFPHWKLVRP